MKLKGKVAVVTGAGRNIGEEIAKTLAHEGAKVVVNDLVLASAQRVCGEIRQAGGIALALQADVGDPGMVAGMMEQTVKEFGAIHILVNNVAVTIDKPLIETTLEEWDRVMAVVLRGTFLCCKYAVAQMIKQGQGGAILNFGSGLGGRGAPGKSAYCAAKGGVINLSRQLATELAPHRIRVNCLSPGRTGTAVGFDAGEEKRPFAYIPLKRLGKPRDQAAAALFLVSDDAEYITGVNLDVDGGVSARSPG